MSHRWVWVVLAALLGAGCETTQPSKEVAKAAAPAQAPSTAPIAPTPEPARMEPTPAPAAAAPSPAPSAAVLPPTPTPAKPAAPPKASVPAAPAKPPPAQVAVAPRAPSPPPLDLKTLEQRLKDTSAIGVLTKLSLKNQVDDLVTRFRTFHAGQRPPTLADLKPAFDLLLMKVLSLLQDHDTALANDINASRDAIWELLADRDKFSKYAI